MKMATIPDDDEIPEIDLANAKGAVRGKYYERYKSRLRLVRLSPEVAERFPSVNDALRL
jgi:hypothetical protein